MAGESLEITIEDLRALAEINPLAWEQLLHIVDMRLANKRIQELEARLSDGHSGLSDLEMTPNTPASTIGNGKVEAELTT